MLCCCGFDLALLQSTTTTKIDSEHTQDYKKLLRVCEAEIPRACTFSMSNTDKQQFSAILML